MILSRIIYSKSCIFYYMKNIKYSLLLSAIIVLVSITFYPVFFKQYEERLSIVRHLINLLLLLISSSYTSISLKKYSFGIYKFYKLLGVTELQNVTNFIKNNASMYYLYFSLFFSTVYTGNVLVALLSTSQFVLCCLGFILLSYMLMHKCRCKTVVFWFFILICTCYMVCFLYRLTELMTNHMTFEDLLLFISNSVLIKIHCAIFYKANLCCMIIVTILDIFTICIISKLDDISIIEDDTRRRVCHKDMCINHFIETTKCSLLRNVKIAFRNKENLVSYLLLFIGYVICCRTVGYVRQLFLATSLFCIALANFGLEGIYLTDIETFQLYKICGGCFSGFLRNKIKVSVLINFCFFSVYTMACILNRFANEWIVLLLFQLINVAYWNTYYSYLYSGMNLTRTMIYEMKRFIAFIIGFIPVVNLIFGIMYYLKGKRRWIYYVNNG